MQNEHYTILSKASRLRDGANRFLQKELNAVGLGELGTASGDIFFELFNAQAVTVSDLARRTRRTKATISVMIDRLERLGYLKKVPVDNDKRLTIIELTPQGLALQPIFDDISLRLNKSLLAGLSPSEASMLEMLLGRVLANFELPK